MAEFSTYRRVGNRELMQWYMQYNRKYFGGRLPTGKVVVKFVRTVDGDRRFLGHCRAYDKDGSVLIRISATLASMRAVARMTLIHEMTHAYLDLWRVPGKRPDRNPHGRRFVEAMRKHAAAGAFDGLW